MSNKVKQHRISKGLSQKKLAELAGTSQQQVQRIETGAISPNLTLAAALSGALGLPLERVFPGATKAIQSNLQALETGKALDYDKAAKSGLELDPCIWTMRLLLRGHEEALSFQMDAANYRSMHSKMQSGQWANDLAEFAVCDTSTCRVAVNLREVQFFHFKFDMPSVVQVATTVVPDEDHDACGQQIQVTFRGSSKRYGFDVDTEEPNDSGADFNDAPIAGLFLDLELGEVGKGGQVCFTDDAGEQVFLSMGEISLFEAAHEILSGYEDVEEED